MLDVVTVFAPRDEYPNWREYLPLLELQRRTAEKFGHRHVVVTDTAGAQEELSPGSHVGVVDLPQSLMHLQLAGQIAYLEQWSGDYPLVFVDADCLIGRDLSEAFGAPFDLGLTSRDDPRCPINNGAMYVSPGGKKAALCFFRAAYDLCGEHWGGDQEAISKAAEPVFLAREGRVKVGIRSGARIGFLSMRHFNCVPRIEGAEHTTAKPFVIHFKGEQRKPWMATYATRFILKEGR